MTPNFPETNEALYHTLYYFKIGRIAMQIKKMAGGLNLSHLDSYHEVALRSHKDMENEINQNAIGSIDFIKQSLFEYLRSWLNSWQFNPGFEGSIEWLIDQENENELARYKAEIENDEIEYKKTIPEGIEEGQEYEVHFKPYYDIFIKAMRPARTEILVNKFITTKKPDLIDKAHLPEYLLLVQNLIDSFRRHSEKYVTNFFAGKYPTTGHITIPPKLPKELPPSNTVPGNKLALNLSVPQVVCLFMALREMGIINEPVNTELARFIRANFTTKLSPDISEKAMANQFSSIDSKAIEFWLDSVKQLRIALVNLKG